MDWKTFTKIRLTISKTFMRAKNILYSLAAGFVAISISIVPAYAKDNFFKRSANAVKEFFSDDKKKDDSTPDKEKKEEKANPEKSGTTTTTTTTTQPESGKIDDKSVTELYDLSFEENKALKYANTSRFRQKNYCRQGKTSRRHATER